MNKPEMAREAERLLDGTGWLAEPLRTPSLETQPVEEPIEEPAAIDAEPVVEPEAALEHDGTEGEEPFAIAAE
jgi:ParB family chromosome partitioning protein